MFYPIDDHLFRFHSREKGEWGKGSTIVKLSQFYAGTRSVSGNNSERKNIFHQLTGEEEEKRRLRRERNKVAASKCRERKKLKMEHLSQVMYDTPLISSVLQREI